MSVINVGGSSSTGTGTIFGDLIEKVYRRVMGGIRERAVQINQTDGIGSDDTTMVLEGPQCNSIQPGTILAIELELIYVDTWDSGDLTVTSMIRGYYGSIPAAHIDGTITYINPKYSRFDIGRAINDDLSSLSAPTNGLFRVGSIALTYNPVYQGYDLGDLPANFIDILEIRYAIAPPYRNFPAIKKWRVLRNVPDAAFPSGMGLIIYEAGWPGLNIYVSYSAPFINLVDESDSVLLTPATNDQDPPYNGYADANIANLTPTMLDLPPLGAEIDLTQPREISRNFMDSQPDARMAPEVVAGAVMASANALMAKRLTRINEEADRLSRQYTRLKGW